MISQKIHLLLFKNLSAFLKNKSGGVGLLALVVTFLGIGIVGVALDYHMYLGFRKKVQGDIDSALLAGGIKCRELYITTNDFDKASQEARTETQDYLVATPSFLPQPRSSPGSFKISTSRSPGTRDRSEGCIITIDFDKKYKTTFTGMFGFKFFDFNGQSSAFANIDLVNSDIEIDFLFDVSNSMSTLADPRDRSLVVALTPSTEGHDSQIKGCIFFCHIRKALLPLPISKNIQDIVDRKITSLTAEYTYQYDGGHTTVNLNEYPFSRKPKSYTYSGPSAKQTINGSNLISLEDLLDIFDVKIKTDLLYESTKTLIQELNLTPDRSRIRVAFHRFNENLETFIPKNQPNEVQPLNTLSPNDLLLSHFEYGVADTEASFFATGDFTPPPADLTSFPLYAPPTGSSTTSSIVRPTANPDYATSPTRSYTYIPKIINQLLAKVAARTAPTRRTQHIVVLITDGVKDENQTGTTTPETRLYDPAICEPLKAQKTIVMVIHSYYRIQPGHLASQGLRNILSGLPAVTINNVDALEKRINEEGLRDKFLLPCASVNPKPGVGEFSHYYYPGNDIVQLKESFHKLLLSILNLNKNDPPVRIQY